MDIRRKGGAFADVGDGGRHGSPPPAAPSNYARGEATATGGKRSCTRFLKLVRGEPQAVKEAATACAEARQQTLQRTAAQRDNQKVRGKTIGCHINRTFLIRGGESEG